MTGLKNTPTKWKFHLLSTGVRRGVYLYYDTPECGKITLFLGDFQDSQEENHLREIRDMPNLVVIIDGLS